MGEELDPSLEPVLAKAFVKRGNAVLIKLGDKEIDFNPDFRLYITTKLGRTPSASGRCLTPAARVMSHPGHCASSVGKGAICRCDPHFVNISRSMHRDQHAMHSLKTRQQSSQNCAKSELMCAGNPPYTPEVSTKWFIVNFPVKQQGLEAQLLNTVVKQERADLDRQKNELVVKVAQGKRTQVSKAPANLCMHSAVCFLSFDCCQTCQTSFSIVSHQDPAPTAILC